ncbi:hypothetical protein PCASD_21285 [Puccinia coronata f. sp. avenae]|uniref:Uncharacterized protein n=1 Tax=Puccinia coronata f. sp. avenae TaxID=200324 RepID=A0A2N5TX46_9BASI|nr:hypothetical protein PCASD_21285 [Puccinia coronata f. sp. avenae]
MDRSPFAVASISVFAIRKKQYLRSCYNTGLGLYKYDTITFSPSDGGIGNVIPFSLQASSFDDDGLLEDYAYVIRGKWLVDNSFPSQTLIFQFNTSCADLLGQIDPMYRLARPCSFVSTRGIVEKVNFNEPEDSVNNDATCLIVMSHQEIDQMSSEIVKFHAEYSIGESKMYFERNSITVGETLLDIEGELSGLCNTNGRIVVNDCLQQTFDRPRLTND